MSFSLGALPPPGFYASQESVAKKISVEPGYANHVLVAGYHGMGVGIRFISAEAAKAACEKYKGSPKDGHLYGIVEQVEVFFQV